MYIHIYIHVWRQYEFSMDSAINSIVDSVVSVIDSVVSVVDSIVSVIDSVVSIKVSVMIWGRVLLLCTVSMRVSIIALRGLSLIM